MSDIDAFLVEFESHTDLCDQYRKHGESLLKCSVIQPDTLRVEECISFNPKEAFKTGRFICRLADKYRVKIVGKAEPFMVGPSVLKKPMVFFGMPIKRMLKLYEHLGFKVNDDKTVIREPK